MSSTRAKADQIFEQVSHQFFLPPPNRDDAPARTKIIFNFWLDLAEAFYQTASALADQFSIDDFFRIDSFLRLVFFKAMIGEVFHSGDCISHFAAGCLAAMDHELMDKSSCVTMKMPESEAFLHVFLKIDLDNGEWIQVDPWLFKSNKLHKTADALKNPRELDPTIEKGEAHCLVAEKKLNYTFDSYEWKQIGNTLLQFQKQLTKEKIQNLLVKNDCHQWRPQKNLVRIQRALDKRIVWCKMHAERRPSIPLEVKLHNSDSPTPNNQPSEVSPLLVKNS